MAATMDVPLVPAPDGTMIAMNHRPEYLIEAMIDIFDPPDPPSAAPTPRQSSMGTLDRLPPEIMSSILNLLDIQATVRFSVVSYGTFSFMKSRQTYRDLLKYGLPALVALKKVGFLRLHNFEKLAAVLRTDRCEFCLEYGAFIYLPTCKRCCWECLHESPEIRSFTHDDALKMFALEREHIEHLPVLNVIPDEYDIYPIPSPRDCRLISVKETRDIALKVHGSLETLRAAMEKKCTAPAYQITARYLMGITYKPPLSRRRGSTPIPHPGNIPMDRYFGMSSIPLPSVTKDGVQEGMWCFACEAMRLKFSADPINVSREMLAAVVPQGCSASKVLVSLERRARARDDFIEHIKTCYGVHNLDYVLSEIDRSDDFD